MENKHITVLLSEAVSDLVWEQDGIYIDATFGRGGHSRAILEQLSESGTLLAIDKDPQAIAEAEKLKSDHRFSVEQGSFKEMAATIAAQGWTESVSGVLLDLGVSSPQLDDAERGFSFMRDGPLDMRMNTLSGQSAAQWLADVKESDLADVLKKYGEEKFARRIARAIVKEREEAPIERTKQLANIVSVAHPAWEVGKHPATRTFLGIRLYINRELEDLTDVLEQVVKDLKPGGRLVVISFHSLEDRIVKRFMRDKARGDDLPMGLPVTDSQLNRQLKIIGKAVKPSAEEVEQNVRSRSAIMRVAERLPQQKIV